MSEASVELAGAPLATRTARFENGIDLASYLPDRDGFLWMRGGEGFVGRGIATRVDVGTGPDRYRRAASVLADAVMPDGDGRAVAFGSFTFDDAVGGSVVVVPQVVIEARAGASRITTIGTGSMPPWTPTPPTLAGADKVRYAGSTRPEVAWLDAVARATAEIEGGRLGKVVLARDLLVWSKVPFREGVVTHRLAERFPQCFTFAFEGFVGATPELLLRKRGADVESLVLAGSAARGVDDTADADLGADLLRSAKDRREHEVALESVRRVLEPVCDEFAVEPEPSLLKLANVQHLATAIRGRVDPRSNVLEIVAELHPTAAVCGAPRARALEFIRSTEGMDRGRYGGPIGWVDRRGDGEWGIALRCAEIDGGRARLFAGAGIVEGSIPERELEETRLKLRAMRSALDPAS